MGSESCVENPQGYKELRPTMKDGDVLLFKGNGVLSKVIKWKTGSTYSHAGIVAWWGHRLMVIEAVGNGVSALPISYHQSHYKGEVDYFTCTEDISSEQRKNMLAFAHEQLGKKHDIPRLVGFFLRLLFNMRIEKKESSEPPSTYFCSEFVSEVYEKVGIDLEITRSSQFTSPAVIENSNKMKFIGKLF